MSKPYTVDTLSIVEAYIQKDIAGLIIQFSGSIMNMEYAQFRAQIMQLVHRSMSEGYGGVDLLARALSHTFVYNETYALWLIPDLENWGYSCRAWFLEEKHFGDCFLTIEWYFVEQSFENRRFYIRLPTTYDGEESFGDGQPEPEFEEW